jgi:hypothetical protein
VTHERDGDETDIVVTHEKSCAAAASKAVTIRLEVHS